MFFFLQISAQQAGWIWARSASSEGGNYCIRSCADAWGNIYVSGYFITDTICFGTDTLLHTNNYGSDVFLVKYNASGNVLWARNFPAGTSYSNSDAYHDVATDVSGNVYFTVMLCLDSAVFGNYTVMNDSANSTWTLADVVVVKCDPSGNVLWANRAGADRSDVTAGICVDNDQNVFVTGWFFSDTIFFAGDTLVRTPDTSPLYDYCDIFVLKYDSLGNEMWARQGVGNLTDAPESIAVDASGSIYITGFYESDGLYFDNWIVGNQTGIPDFFIMKYDGDGNAMWVKKAVGTDQEFGLDVTVDGTGEIVATGSFRSASITFGSLTLQNSTNGSLDIFLVKYDPFGNVIWARKAGGLEDDFGRGICVNANNDIFLTGIVGYGYSVFGNDTCWNNGSLNTTDAFIAKYDAAGNAIWVTSASGNGADQGNSISVDPNGDVYLAGFYWINLSLGSLTLNNVGSGGSEIFLAKLGGTTGAEELPARNNVLVYPNPAGDNVQLDIDNFAGEQLMVSVCDVTGRSIIEYDVANVHNGTDGFVLNVEFLWPGIYLIRVGDGEQESVVRFVKN